MQVTLGRVGWPLIVRLQHIENATAADAGRFASRSIAPVAVPPALSRWLATFCVNTSEPIVGLTFDDGPNPVNTPKILDLLAERGATATFFVLAPQVEAYPNLARRIVDEGHEIALHGIDHRSLLTMSSGVAAREIRQAKARVESVAGTKLRLYRPPYGEYTAQQAVRLRLLGLETIIWSGDSRDWDTDDENAITARALASVIPGGIILFHDHRGDPETLASGRPPEGYDRAAVLGDILDQLDRDGFRTRRVNEMLATHQPVRSIARYGLGQSDQNKRPEETR